MTKSYSIQKCSFQGKNDKKLLDTEGYHLISLSTYTDLSKKTYEPLSFWVVPISENLASGPWTNMRGDMVEARSLRNQVNRATAKLKL